MSSCKGKKNFDAKKESNPTHGMTMEAQMNLQKSTEIMADFLKEGELNPQVEITRKGFLHMFSAWILDESLPWTTGEAPTLQMLFKYL